MGKIWGNMGGKIPHISPIFSPYFTPPHNGGTSMPRGGGGYKKSYTVDSFWKRATIFRSSKKGEYQLPLSGVKGGVETPESGS